jgi:hypothetical protein
VYTLNFRIKKAAIHEKTTGYGFNPLEKNGFYSKLTLANFFKFKPLAPLPALRAYRPEGRAYAPEGKASR